MPIILQIFYTDKTEEQLYIPAQIWRKNPHNVSKLLVREKLIAKVIVDPNQDLADADLQNNYFPRKIGNERLKLINNKKKKRNLMKEMEQ